MSKSTHQSNRYHRRAYPKVAIKVMEDILNTPSGPERWRKIMEAWLLTNPIEDVQFEDGTTAQWTARQVLANVIEDNKQLRSEQTNKFSAIGEGSMRMTLNVPASLWGWLKAFDRPAFDRSFGDDEVRRNLKKFTEAFKVFVIPEAV